MADMHTAFDLVFDAMRGLQTVQTVGVGLQLGLLSTLRDDGPMTPGVLAERLGLLAHPVRVWCDVAYAYGVLERAPDQADGAVALAPGMDVVLLDAQHPRYLGGYVQGMTGTLWDDYVALPTLFTDGVTAPFWERGASFSAWVASLTHPMQRLVVARLLPDLFGPVLARDGGADVLDVGCGAGQLLRAVVQAFPGVRGVGVDADAHGVALARDMAHEAGLGDQLRFEALPAQAMTFDSAFDLALMFEVLHELPLDVRGDALAATYRALRPGGALFIVDESWPDDPAQLRDPAYRFSVLVQFSELRWGNVVATESEQARLLAGAGFHDVQRGSLGGVFATLVARKGA